MLNHPIITPRIRFSIVALPRVELNLPFPALTKTSEHIQENTKIVTAN
jgi:hypothetical protein